MELEKSVKLKKGTKVRAISTSAYPSVTGDKIYELQGDARPDYFDPNGIGLFSPMVHEKPENDRGGLRNCHFPIIDDGGRLDHVYHGLFTLAED